MRQRSRVATSAASFRFVTLTDICSKVNVFPQFLIHGNQRRFDRPSNAQNRNNVNFDFEAMTP